MVDAGSQNLYNLNLLLIIVEDRLEDKFEVNVVPKFFVEVRDVDEGVFPHFFIVDA